MARLNRKQKTKRALRPVFLLGCEGNTECNYFKYLNQTLFRTIVFEFPGSRNHNSDPGSVLKALKQAIKNRKDITGAWVIIDTDNRKPEEFNTLESWSQTNPTYGLAISNPCFELWLLLHVDDKFPQTETAVKTALKKQFPNWKKPNCPPFTEAMVNQAVVLAKRNDKLTPPNSNTTVYKLIEVLFQNRSDLIL
jgi:hypothetical protein